MEGSKLVLEIAVLGSALTMQRLRALSIIKCQKEGDRQQNNSGHRSDTRIAFHLQSGVIRGKTLLGIKRRVYSSLHVLLILSRITECGLALKLFPLHSTLKHQGKITFAHQCGKNKNAVKKLLPITIYHCSETPIAPVPKSFQIQSHITYEDRRGQWM